MNRFLEMPLPQRLLVTGVVLVFLGVVGYFLFISSASDEITIQNNKYKKVMEEYSRLKEYDSPEFKDKLERERAEAYKRKSEYEKMLPREEEVPNLITTIKRDADAAGLVLMRFERLKQTIEGEGYRGIPVAIEVTGTFHQLISFLQALAAPAKRLVNAKDLNIGLATNVQGIEQKIGDVGLLRVLAEREKERGLTPPERYAKTVLLFEEISASTPIHAVFTAMAYIYTGGQPMAQGGQPR